MKKLVLILGLVMIGLMLTACAPQQTAPRTVPSAEAPAVEESEDVEVVEDVVEDVPETEEAEPAEVVEDEPEVEEQPAEVVEDEPEVEEQPAEVTTTFTQEDLDRLQQDIEGIQTDDLGGLSE